MCSVRGIPNAFVVTSVGAANRPIGGLGIGARACASEVLGVADVGGADGDSGGCIV